jgi:hypothetical protein
MNPTERVIKEHIKHHERQQQGLPDFWEASIEDMDYIKELAHQAILENERKKLERGGMSRESVNNEMLDLSLRIKKCA